MRDQLIGYLLNALEPAERERLEEALAADPQLQSELEVLVECLEPMRADDEHYDPPRELARRTCIFVAQQVAAAEVVPLGTPLPSRWSMADMMVAAGMFVAVSLLFFPAVSQSHYSAQLMACQNNLRQLGLALTKYSQNHDNTFPVVPSHGRLAVAGIYAPKLVDDHLVDDLRLFICPASLQGNALLPAETISQDDTGSQDKAASSADGGSQATTIHAFRIPSIDQMCRASDGQLAQWHRQIGGSYAYNIGYAENEENMPTRNSRRKSFAILADVPSGESNHQSSNHGGGGQNVLMEDGHVVYLTCCQVDGCRDDIYVNDWGHIAAGLHVDDAVLGSSATRPLISPAMIDGVGR